MVRAASLTIRLPSNYRLKASLTQAIPAIHSDQVPPILCWEVLRPTPCAAGCAGPLMVVKYPMSASAQDQYF